jgi:hypothetical protein
VAEKPGTLGTLQELGPVGSKCDSSGNEGVLTFWGKDNKALISLTA